MQSTNVPLGFNSAVHFVKLGDFDFFAHEVILAAENVEKLVHQVIEKGNMVVPYNIL